MTSATVKMDFRGYEDGPVQTEEIEFTDSVDAIDYAETLYRMGRVESAVVTDQHGREVFSVQREQFDFGAYAA